MPLAAHAPNNRLRDVKSVFLALRVLQRGRWAGARCPWSLALRVASVAGAWCAERPVALRCRRGRKWELGV
jgi:hypothetical protein